MIAQPNPGRPQRIEEGRVHPWLPFVGSAHAENMADTAAWRHQHFATAKPNTDGKFDVLD